MDPAVTQATFCATLVDEWAAAGVRHAAVAPGSRSTPMAFALAADERVAVHVFHDERCAAFAALGVGVATGVPAVVLTTSGTAATHLHAAVVEAHHAGVPLLALTADRPPELRGVGAPQTIDQEHLYGQAVRWFADPGVADESGRQGWRSLATRALEAATGDRPGPVHLNLPFREPLVAPPGDLPARTEGRGRARSARHDLRVVGRRPLVVASRPVDAPHLPVLADPRSGIAGGIRHADALLRVPAVREGLRPDLIVRVGSPPASRVVNEWLAASGAHEVCDVLGWDPYGTVAATGTVDLSTIRDLEPGWRDRWLELDDLAEKAIAEVLAAHERPTEPGTARDVLAGLPAGAHLVVASSMPVRDLEWFATPRPDVAVHANRGVNGIDGTISTALGVAAATGAPTAALLGDVAFLHDVGALVGIADRGLDLTLVVLDNDGGGIFSFLPQAEALPPDRFEQLFGTPHGLRVEHVAAGFGLASLTVESADAVAVAVQGTAGAGGVHVVVVRTDRAANRALHDELHAAVAAAVSGR